MSFFPQQPGGFFGQGSFQVDPNSTPEMLARKREMIAAMMPRFGEARYVGQGIGQLATGIASGMKAKALDKFEGERRQEASAQFNNLFSGGGGGVYQQGGPLSILGVKPSTPPNPNDAKYPTGAEGPAPMGNVDPASGLSMGAPVGGGIPEEIKNGIFAGESGGDYNALFGFQNRDGGRYSNVRLTDMTVDQALDFANPRGEYGQWVKGQVGRVATPMGAYQIVGTTLRAAKEGLGLTGNEKMTPELQDALGYWIYQKQGTGAWEGYKGPQSSFKPGPGVQVAQGKTNPAGANYGGQLNALLMAAQNPYLSPQQVAVVNSQIQQIQGQQKLAQQQQMRQSDPMYQIQLAQAQLNLEQDRNGGGRDAATVQSSVPLDDGTTVMIMNDGTRRVLGPAGNLLQGQDAAEAIKSAREYTVENQQDVYAARRTGTLGADLKLGGEVAATEDIAKATVKAGVSAWEDYGKLQSSIGTIGEAIAAIDSGAESGLIYKMLPNITEASASLQNAMDRMGLDVVGSVTFGALSEGELRLAMQTAVPRDLGPKELRSWLVKKQAAQQKASAMLADAAQFMTTPGNTINDWITKNRAAKNAAPASGLPPIPPGAENFGAALHQRLPEPNADGWIELNGLKIRPKR